MQNHYNGSIKSILVFIAFLCCTNGKTVPKVCEPITVELCKDMPYNFTKLPNSLNHNNQQEINRILTDFDQVLKTGCSSNLRKFLCSLFVPFCTELDTHILPCNDLCLDNKNKCEKYIQRLGFRWPDILDCEKFPEQDQTKFICVPLQADYNDTGIDSTELVFSYKDVDSKEVEVDSTFKEQIILLVSTRHHIMLYNVPSQDLITLKSGLDKAASIDYHYKENYIFWAEEEIGTINRATLTLDVLRDIRVLYETVQSNVESIAVDWVTNHIFWLESYPARLKVSALDGMNPTLLYEFKKDHNNKERVPKYLTIDPLAGYLFWAEFAGDVYSPGVSIERFDLKHRSKIRIFNVSSDILHNMGRPKGLTLDMKNKKVFWADARSESIQSVGYSGRNLKMLVTSPRYLGEPLALTMYKQNLFWSDDVTNSIGKTNVRNSKQLSFIETLTHSEAIGLKVFHQDLQPTGKVQYTIVLENGSDLPHGHSAVTVFICSISFVVLLS